MNGRKPTKVPFDLKHQFYDKKRCVELLADMDNPEFAKITTKIELQLSKIRSDVTTSCTNCQASRRGHQLPEYTIFGYYPPLPETPHIYALFCECNSPCGEEWDSVAVDLSNDEFPMVHWATPPRITSPTKHNKEPLTSKRDRSTYEADHPISSPLKQATTKQWGDTMEGIEATAAIPTIPMTIPSINYENDDHTNNITNHMGQILHHIGILTNLVNLIPQLSETLGEVQNKLVSLEANIYASSLRQQEDSNTETPLNTNVRRGSQSIRGSRGRGGRYSYNTRDTFTSKNPGADADDMQEEGHTEEDDPSQPKAKLTFKEAFLRKPPPPKDTHRIFHTEYSSIFIRVHPQESIGKITPNERLNLIRDHQKELGIYDSIARTRSIGKSLYHLLVPTILLPSVRKVLQDDDITILDKLNLEDPPPTMEKMLLHARTKEDKIERRKELLDQHKDKTIYIAARFYNSLPDKNPTLKHAFLDCFPTWDQEIEDRATELEIERPYKYKYKGKRTSRNNKPTIYDYLTSLNSEHENEAKTETSPTDNANTEVVTPTTTENHIIDVDTPVHISQQEEMNDHDDDDE